MLQTIIPESESFNVIPLCLETFEDITLSVNHFLTVDTIYFERPVAPLASEVNRTFQCNWTGKVNDTIMINISQYIVKS